jgi:nucleoside 2-deoxyribosyltransferase
MPFAARFDDTFYLGVVPAADEAKLSCVRMDDGMPRQLVIAAIHKEIQEADYFIADLTDANPNVVYEFGYANALNKPVLLLSATRPEELPFDLRPWSMIVYSPGQVWKLKDQLSKALVHLAGGSAPVSNDDK